jgi:hypothetical protein
MLGLGHGAMQTLGIHFLKSEWMIQIVQFDSYLKVNSFTIHVFFPLEFLYYFLDCK